MHSTATHVQHRVPQPALRRVRVRARVPHRGYRDPGRADGEREAREARQRAVETRARNEPDQLGVKRDPHRVRISRHDGHDGPLEPELRERVVHGAGEVLLSRGHDMLAGSIARGRDPLAPDEWVSSPDDADEVVAEERLPTDLRRGRATARTASPSSQAGT